jgi:putative ABC transport system permease protein
VLVGETMLLAILAQPLGWLFGAWIATALVEQLHLGSLRYPAGAGPAIFAQASLIVLATSLVSVLLVRRRIDRMDLVAVMKTRE